MENDALCLFQALYLCIQFLFKVLDLPYELKAMFVCQAGFVWPAPSHLYLADRALKCLFWGGQSSAVPFGYVPK